MDLPFLNNAPEPAPAPSAEGADLWGGFEAGSGSEEASLNDLLALYQTASEPSSDASSEFAPPFALAPEEAPLPFAAPTADLGFTSPAAPPPAPTVVEFNPPPRTDKLNQIEIDDLIRSYHAAQTSSEAAVAATPPPPAVPPAAPAVVSSVASPVTPPVMPPVESTPTLESVAAVMQEVVFEPFPDELPAPVEPVFTPPEVVFEPFVEEPAPVEPVFTPPEMVFEPFPDELPAPVEPVFTPPEVVFEPFVEEPAPVEPVFTPPEVVFEPFVEEPAPVEPVFTPPEVVFEPFVEEPVMGAPTLQASVPAVSPRAVVPPAPIPVATLKSAAPELSVASAIPEAALADVKLGTSEERHATMMAAAAALSQLTGSIDQVQSEMGVLYQDLAQAAANRASLVEIISLTERLSSAKNQGGENSPLWQQAMMLRQVADAYLAFIKNM